MGRGGIGRLVAALAALLALAPWLVMALWSRPSLDDFCFFGFVRTHGWLGTQLFAYQTLVGRYSSTALFTGIGWLTDRLGSDPAILYAAMAWLIILAILAFAWRSVGLLVPALTPGDRLIVAGFVGAAFLATLPGAADVLFWANGVAVYLISMLLVWHFLLQPIATAAGRPPPGPAGIAGLGGLAFLGAGLNELTVPLLILVLAAWGFLGLHRGWAPRDLAGLALIAGAGLLGFAIVDAAPGNDWRFSAFPGSRNLLVGLPWSLVDGATFLLLRIAVVPTLIGLLALAWLEGSRRAAKPGGMPPLWLLPALFLAACLVAFAISRYSMARGLPHRAQDLVYTVGFVTLAAAASWHGRAAGSARWAGWSRQQRRRAVGAAILLCLAGPTEWLAFYDAVASGPRYAAENDRRTQILAAAGAVDITVPLLASQPKLLFIGDLTTDPRHWYNRCVADYFGNRSVAAR